MSGHNETGTWSDLRSYHRMLVQTTALIRDGLEAGKEPDVLKAEKVLDEWASYAGSYVSVEEWIDTLAEGLQGQEDDGKPVFGPLYQIWKERGAVAAVEYYFELKRDHADRYRFSEATFLVIGNKLLGKSKYQAAATFLEASLRDYPDSKYAYYTNYKLAEAHRQLGDRGRAVRYCRSALRLNPEFEAAAALLEELERR